jgi:hypothetical protein
VSDGVFWPEFEQWLREHEPDCAWRLAREWIAANPG